MLGAPVPKTSLSFYSAGPSSNRQPKTRRPRAQSYALTVCLFLTGTGVSQRCRSAFSPVTIA